MSGSQIVAAFLGAFLLGLSPWLTHKDGHRSAALARMLLNAMGAAALIGASFG